MTSPAIMSSLCDLAAPFSPLSPIHRPIFPFAANSFPRLLLRCATGLSTSSSNAAVIGMPSPFPDDPDPDLYGDRGEGTPSTSITLAAGCGHHALRAPKEGHRVRFLPDGVMIS